MLIYQNEKGDTKVDVYFFKKDIWMSQAAIAQMYNTTPQNITMHIKNIYEDGELDEESTCKEFLQVQTEGTRQIKRNKKHYNFRMILAIGYRVRSNVGIHFRNWASGILEEYTRKGFAMNDERLKNPKQFGEDYFDELLERIRDISLRCSWSYCRRVDYAEDQARRRIPMYMKDWEEKLNNFLNMTGREVLSGAGYISADQAKRHALKQYEIYDEHRLQMQEKQVVDELLQNAKDIKQGKK